MEKTIEAKKNGPRTALRRGLVATLGLAAVAAGGWYFGRPGAVSAEPSAKPEQQTVSRIERGRYLVTIGGCNDCHTPFKMTPTGPRPDMDRMLSGHPEQMKLSPAPKASGPWVWSGAATNTAFAGPWGVSFTANLTPDKDTGLGSWTEEMFIATMRTARHQGKGRPILPPMPVKMIGKANDEDLKSIFAYLQSLPPVKNKVPAPIDPPEK